MSFQTHPSQMIWPCEHLAVVTPSDANDLAADAKWLFVGGAGDVEVITSGGETVIIAGVPAGAQLPIRVTRVKAANTTATDIVAGW